VLATPRDADGLGRFMQRVGRRYVPEFHRRHGTRGSLSTSRFQSAALQPEHYLLRAIAFVEQAPVRAGLATHANDWQWSSAQHHTGARRIAGLTEHPMHWRLGNTPFEREVKHGDLLERALTLAQVAELEASIRGGWPLGDASFLEDIRKISGRRSEAAPRGRKPGSTTKSRVKA
jgi:putative transposase